MSRSTAIKLPALDLSSVKSTPPLRARARSSSIVKVEEVGDRSIDEVLDRGAYVNINADWVNAKGTSPWFLSHICSQPIPSRCVADPRRSHHSWKNNHRHCPRDDPTNQLDTSKPAVPSRMPATLSLGAVANLILHVPALVSHVSLGNWHSLRKRPTWRRIRRFDVMGANR
jgi:hypothetical protein